MEPKLSDVIESIDKENFEKATKPKITAFHHIFEDKLNHMITKIKKLRKDPDSKTKVKELVAEAKALKKLIKKEKKEQHNHHIQVSLDVITNESFVIDSSSRIQILNAKCVDNILTIVFDVKPLG